MTKRLETETERMAWETKRRNCRLQTHHEMWDSKVREMESQVTQRHIHQRWSWIMQDKSQGGNKRRNKRRKKEWQLFQVKREQHVCFLCLLSSSCLLLSSSLWISFHRHLSTLVPSVLSGNNTLLSRSDFQGTCGQHVSLLIFQEKRISLFTHLSFCFETRKTRGKKTFLCYPLKTRNFLKKMHLNTEESVMTILFF